AEARTVGSAARASAVRDRAAAAVHRSRAVWRHHLSYDESGHDVGAAGDENVRIERQRFKFRYSVAYRGDVWAELFYRLLDRAFRRTQGRRGGPAARSRRRCDRPLRHLGNSFLVDPDRAGDRLES